jgi:6-pyruvoyltetrahydropterin/6-carboxytetrahydropterin synthase
LYNPGWTDERNYQVFGKCSNPNFHGHNYEVIVKIIGEPDPRTGYVMDMKLLSDMIKEHVLSRFDHKNLNLDTVFFRELNPTAENICIVIYDILRKQIDEKLQMQVRLYETERNFVEYPVMPE